MGIFDAIKDALTVDDQERYEAAVKQLDAARARAEKVNGDYDASQRDKDAAQRAVTEAQTRVDEFAAKAGVQAPVAPVEPVAPAEPVVQEQSAPAEPVVQEEPVAQQEPAPAEPLSVPEPAPEPEPVAPAEPALREYTVKKGDTLSHIGKVFGVNWRDIASLNNVKNPDLIFPGQVFRIPN